MRLPWPRTDHQAQNGRSDFEAWTGEHASRRDGCQRFLDRRQAVGHGAGFWWIGEIPLAFRHLWDEKALSRALRYCMNKAPRVVFPYPTQG